MSMTDPICRRPWSAAVTVALVCLIAWTLAAGNAGDPQIQRVSVSSSGQQGNGEGSSGGCEGLSADGRYVVFSSESSNLVADDTNDAVDVFVRDLSTQQTSRVSVSSGGEQGNGNSGLPAISADGRYVAFYSAASNLVANDTNGANDVFVRDLVTQQTIRASVDSAGGQANGRSHYAAISADGRYLAFQSEASNLVPGDTNGCQDIFRHDCQTGATVRASVNTSGQQGNALCGMFTHAMRSDGRYVAFQSAATNLVAGDTNGKSDVFVRDLQSGTTVRGSVSTLGEQGNDQSTTAALSAGGRFLAFQSHATNLASGGLQGAWNVYLRDLVSGQTSLVSVNADGDAGNGLSSDATVSNDGRYVAFYSAASDLVPHDTNGGSDAFVRDLLLGYTSRVSVSRTGQQGNAETNSPAIGADGRLVVFDSAASNLVLGDTNGAYDVFIGPAPAGTTAPTPPTAVAILPTEPGTADDLTATASGGADPHGDTVTYVYQWSKKAGASVAWDAWGRDGATLPNALTTKGEQWRARARVNGAMSASTWVAGAAVTIVNTPPAPPTTVEATPAGGSADAYTVVASASGASDADEDAISYAYQWSKSSDGGSTWSDWGWPGATVAHADLITGDHWKARARAFDGTGYSTWVASNPLATSGGALYVDAAVAASGDGSSWQTAFKTISEAVRVAIPGGTVTVAPGTYRERVSFGGKTLSLTGTDPSSPSVSAATIIDGGSAGPVVSFVGGESAETLLSGFTITGGKADNGGGITCQGGAAPVISHNRIQGNVADREGGGISCRSASATVIDNTISGNHAAGDGGGLRFSGSGTPVAARNIIRDNTAANGAGVVCKNGSAEISDNTIRGNTATQGGGLCCLSGAEPVVSANSFLENKADYGGAIYCEGATPTIRGNTISANGADGGAGLYLYNCSPALISNTIVDNTADDGAGVFGQGCASLVRDSILADNAATRYGGGVYLLNSSGARLENCTLDGNGATAKGGGVCLDNSAVGLHNTVISNSRSGGGVCLVAGPLPTITYCNLFNNLPTDYVGMSAPAALALAGSKGNLSQDPGYADRKRRDYHPKSETGRWNAVTGAWIVDTSYSPCIDAGDPASAYAREPQPNGRRINLGAYGNTAEASKAAGLIVAHRPASNATACPRGTAIVLTFRWPVTPASAESHLVVASAGGTSVKGAYRWLVPAVQMSFTPETPLEMNAVYNVTLTPGTKRSDGPTATWAENFSFTTGNEPAVIWSSPRGEAVTPRANIVVRFDTMMHRRSVENTFRVTPAVAGRFGWSGQQLTFTHPKHLLAGTTYKVSVGPRARSGAGKQLGRPFSWTFTTAGPPASVAMAAVAVPTAVGAQIGVTLASAADVTVSVRNIAGREVAFLQPGLLQAGTQLLVWNGRSKSSTKVPAGTYLVQVQARDPRGAVASQLLSLRLR